MEGRVIQSMAAAQHQRPSPERSWANLPSEILCRIISKFATSAAKYVSFRRVCSNWAASLFQHSPFSPLPYPQLPFLLVPPRVIASPLGFVFPLHSPLPFPMSFSLPQLASTHRRICVGSSHGWLLSLGPDSSFSLLNPITTDSLPLPPLSSIDRAILSFNPSSSPEYYLPQKKISRDQFNVIHRAVLSSDPAKDPDFTVLLFLSELTDSCFMCRAGNESWSRYVHSRFLPDDVIFSNGIFVAVMMPVLEANVFELPIRLAFFDFRDRNKGLGVERYQIKKLRMPPRKVFLVESNGNLLLVLKFGQFEPHQHMNPIDYFHVYQFSRGGDERNGLYRIYELPRCALFIGHGCSVSVSPRLAPWLAEGTVYCTHVYCKVKKEGVEGGGEREIAVYHGAVYQYTVRTNISAKVCDVELSKCAALWASPKPYWVSPNLNRR